MRDRVPCEFFLLRYVADVVRGEFVNVGVLLREAAGSETRAEVRFTRDWRRVRCLDADADVALLEGLEQEMTERLRAGVDARRPKAILEELRESLSNSVQITDGRATLAENLATEIEQLMRLYVEPRAVPRVREKSGRTRIQAGMRREFEQAGVWELMRKRIPAALYTRAGDPLRIDCGYRPEGRVKLFQAISLAGEVDSAKGLAFSAAQMREGVARVEGVPLEMTAIVEPLRSIGGSDEESGERYRFGVEAMERQEIRVLTMSDLARVALMARRELGL